MAGVGVPLVPVYQSARADGCAAAAVIDTPARGRGDRQHDAAAAGALSVAEKLGIRSVSVTFQQLTLPALHRPPLAYRGRPFPPEMTDKRVL